MDNINNILDEDKEGVEKFGKILYSRSQDITSLAEALNEINEEESAEIINQNTEEIFESGEEDNLIDNNLNSGRGKGPDLPKMDNTGAPACAGGLKPAMYILEDAKDIFSGDNARAVVEEINICNDNKEDDRKVNVIEIFSIKKKLLKIKYEIEEILEELDSEKNLKAYEKKFTDVLLNEKTADNLDIGAAKIIEGVFDGFKMIAEDGEKYDVPMNYASKSKLVEGDILKLRILPTGAHRYKQIEKVERRNSVGILNYNEETKEYFVVLDNERKYKVLTASITYYKAAVGDEIIITIPVDWESKWAAVEGISIKQ